MTVSKECGCSNPEDDGLQAPPKLEAIQPTSVERGTMKGRHGDALNKEKLDTYVLRVVKKTIGKCEIGHRGRALVCWSGGLSSTTMLHMIERTVSKEKRRKSYFEWDILFIDMNGDISKEECLEVLKSQNYSFQNFYFERLKMDQNALKSKVIEASVLEDMVQQCIQKQIVDFALKNNYKKVLLGTSANRLAIRILGDITKGRGTSIPLAISFRDDRLREVDLCRPLKEFLLKELGFYLYFHKLRTIHQNEPVTMKPVKTYSIERLIETFIEGLQREFPGTVHTILRTCDKLREPQSHFSEQFGKNHPLMRELLSNRFVLCPECFTIASKEDIQSSLDDESIAICYGCKRNWQIVEKYRAMQQQEEDQEPPAPTLSCDESDEASFEFVEQQRRLLSRSEMKDLLKDVLLDYNDEIHDEHCEE